MLYKFIDSNRIEPQPKSLVTGDIRYCNPSEDMLRQNGYKTLSHTEAPSRFYDMSYADGDEITTVWTEWTAERKEQHYPALVAELIRQTYSVDDELALLRQRDVKPNEFAQYNDFVEHCKIEAREQLGIVHDGSDLDDYTSDSEVLGRIQEVIDNEEE